ncbi:hypothetical protein HPT25_05940 [Bacillus sp. BRMEA1]|uniref:hypothetical protein n=1 Tax=Neobacillus endophyticus TaxID=2738405 RepID=UPI001564ACF6|nr:hypothetical protein [Neobacillus endophyticus]NRD77036.1 hypothetical protein [Neobacillus endophyticus]
MLIRTDMMEIKVKESESGVHKDRFVGYKRRSSPNKGVIQFFKKTTILAKNSLY